MAVRGFFGSLVQATKFPDNVALVEPVGHLALDLVDLSHLVDVAIEDGSGGTSTLRARPVNAIWGGGHQRNAK